MDLLLFGVAELNLVVVSVFDFSFDNSYSSTTLKGQLEFLGDWEGDLGGGWTCWTLERIETWTCVDREPCHHVRGVREVRRVSPFSSSLALLLRTFADPGNCFFWFSFFNFVESKGSS